MIFLLFEVFKEIVIICDSILLRAGDFGMCPFNGIWKWVCNENMKKTMVAQKPHRIRLELKMLMLNSTCLS